jgi:DNA-binding FrmR family transcriptional regulator
MRKKRPLERSGGVVRDARLIVIASEDRYAVRQYFEFFRSTQIQFKVLETEAGKSAPQYVLARMDQYREEFTLGEDDQFWLVLDTDHWINPAHIANLMAVMQQCGQKGIEVAMSNPCFELWLLLHFAEFPTEDQLTCDEVAEQIRAAAGSYNKTRVDLLEITHERVGQAIERSVENQLAKKNPPERVQTHLHRLLKELVTAGLVQIPEPEGE